MAGFEFVRLSQTRISKWRIPLDFQTTDTSLEWECHAKKMDYRQNFRIDLFLRRVEKLGQGDVQTGLQLCVIGLRTFHIQVRSTHTREGYEL